MAIKYTLLVALALVAVASAQFCSPGTTCAQPDPPQPSDGPTPTFRPDPSQLPVLMYQTMTINYRCRDQGDADSFCPEDMTCDYISAEFGPEWVNCNDDSDREHYDDRGNGFKAFLWAQRGDGAGQVTDAEANQVAADYRTTANCTDAACTVVVMTNQPWSAIVPPAPSATPTPSMPAVCPETCAPVTGSQCRKTKVKKVSDGDVCYRQGACLESDGSVTVYVCDDDSRCVINSDNDCGVCEPRTVAAIGEACDDDTICREDNFDVHCLDDRTEPICGNEDVLAPGQSCSATETAVFDGDGCAIGDCLAYDAAKCPNGECCEFDNTDESCAMDLSCKFTDYCDIGDTGECKARLGEGSECTRDRECGAGHFCAEEGDTDRCRALFSLASGGECSDRTHCMADLCCNPNGADPATCAAAGTGSSCTGPDDDSCGPCGACVCNGNKGEFECAYDTNDQKDIDVFMAMINCGGSAGCDEFTLFNSNGVEYFPEGGCMAASCRSETDEAADRFFAQDSGASAVAVAVTLLVAVVAMVL